FTRRDDSFIGDRGDAIEKEIDPTLPVTLQPHEVKAPVVFFAVTLEEEAEIEKRSPHEPQVFQQEGDHQAPDPPIAIEIGMNGFELRMQESRPHELRQPVIGMDVFLEGAEKLREFLGGRWNISRVPGPASANPVLAAAYFSGLLAPAAHAAH